VAREPRELTVMARTPRSQPVRDGIFEPNMTPLIDVSLVLVVILMVATPLAFQSAIAVRTASSAGRASAVKSDTDRIEVSVAVDDRNVTATSLGPAVAARLAQPGNASVLVVVRADTSTPYASVKSALESIRQAGAKRIAIATRQKGVAAQ